MTEPDRPVLADDQDAKRLIADYAVPVLRKADTSQGNDTAEKSQVEPSTEREPVKE